ncbi:MAG: carboxypeptidase-like regulatory domain-containing protein [Pyrinomonadaceae bacterium]
MIRKEVVTPDGTGSSTVAFGFSASPNFGVTSFSLVDDNSGPGQDFRSATLSVTPGMTATLTVTETNSPRGWTLVNVDCVENMTQDSTRNSVGPATINLQAGETVVCTFTNSGLGVTAAPATIGGQVRTEAGSPIEGARLTLRNMNTGEVRSAVTNNFGSYRFDDVMTDDFYVLTVSSKGHEFASPERSFTLRESISDVDFIASGGGR